MNNSTLTLELLVYHYLIMTFSLQTYLFIYLFRAAVPNLFQLKAHF